MAQNVTAVQRCQKVAFCRKCVNILIYMNNVVRNAKIKNIECNAKTVRYELQ